LPDPADAVRRGSAQLDAAAAAAQQALALEAGEGARDVRARAADLVGELRVRDGDLPPLAAELGEPVPEALDDS
jgi:hypothetical protein